jgi:hypothetical protein
VDLPSDLVRTEYIQFDRSFSRRFGAFLGSLAEPASYYLTLADQLENDPLLAIDYLRRSYLLTGDVSLRRRATAIFDDAGFTGRARHSVERNLAQF